MPTPSAPPIAVELGPDVALVGKLLGLLDKDGTIDEDWFKNPAASLAEIPTRVPELVGLIERLLGPAAGDAPAAPDGARWFPVPNPDPTATAPTPLYVVAPEATVTEGVLGLGAFAPKAVGGLTVDAYAYAPLFRLSKADPAFVLGTEPLHLGVTAAPTDGSRFEVDGVSFAALDLDVRIPLHAVEPGDPLPSMTLAFVDPNGADGVPATYDSLGDLGAHIEVVGEWISAVLTKGAAWLKTPVGASTVTPGGVLAAACVLKKKKTNDTYALNWAGYLDTATPAALAETFLLNALALLADNDAPILPISVGGDEAGVYVTSEAKGGGTDYGVRLQIPDIAVGAPAEGDGASPEAGPGGDGAPAEAPPPEFAVQLGKWIEGEDDATSWIARARGGEGPKPGLSVFVLHSTAPAGSCTPAPPGVTFAPRVELASVGVDVKGGAGRPLFDVKGYVLGGAEARVLLTAGAEGVTFGAAAALDGLGVPLGPAASGEGETGPGANPVAQSLLASGTPAAGDGAAGDAPPGDAAPVNPAFSLSAAWVEGGEPAVQFYDPGGKPVDAVTIPIRRALGPIECETLGLGWVQGDPASKDRLTLLFDGGVKVGPLGVTLQGLTVGIPVVTPGDVGAYDLDLDGMGLTLTAGAVELSGAFVKVLPQGAPQGDADYVSYNGEVLVKAGPFSIDALGSYAYADDYASLFVFGAADGELGGPPFFFVTGLAAGFGYNRALRLPEMDAVPAFPLVAFARGGASAAPDPAAALQALGDAVPPERGEYWLAAGVRFTSFDLIDTTALLVVEFGHELEIALLGVSSMSLPPPPAPGAAAPAVKFAYAELGVEVKLLPDAGLFSATAILTPNSYVLDPACTLTGGFAFEVWFGPNPHAGQFVLTLGGYHPDFAPPDYFPAVPRLGFRWPVSSVVTISGGAYFALTSSAIMTGGGLEVLFHSGNLKAWFRAQMDALLEWAPFHYALRIGVSVGASYRLKILGITTTLKVELGAALRLWGPPMGGSVHVSWFVISFTVPFGADENTHPPPLPWTNDAGTGFSQTLLPHGAAPADPAAFVAEAGGDAAPLYTVTVNDGLLKTVAGADGEAVWVVRSGHLAFSIATTIPATVIDLAPGLEPLVPTDDARPLQPLETPTTITADYTVYVRPMRAVLGASVLSVSITDAHRHEPVDFVGDFDFTPTRQAVPAAKWGAPVDGAPEPYALLDGWLTGLSDIRPKPPALTPAGDDRLAIDVAKAFTYDVVDAGDTAWLPLGDEAAPDTPPHAAPDALDVVARTVDADDVVGRRSEVFAALRALGLDAGADGRLAALAAAPGRSLSGPPLLTPPGP